MNEGPSKLYLLIILLVGIVCGYLAYSNNILTPAPANISPAPVSKGIDLNTFAKMKIDFSRLGSLSQNLIISGESPVKPAPSGKKDLFAPIQ